jgi:hypothetical protein
VLNFAQESASKDFSRNSAARVPLALESTFGTKDTSSLALVPGRVSDHAAEQTEA